jgi:phenylacetate-CoA ligase
VNSTVFRKFVFPAYHQLRKTKVMQRIQELEMNQWKSEEELADLRGLKLKQLLAHAYESVPYYRQKFDSLDINIKKLYQPEFFRWIPLLTKKDINDNREALISVNLNGSRLIPNRTSGSTGEALYFYTDTHSLSYRRASVVRNQRWLGIKLGDRSASLWGSPMDLKKTFALRGRLHAWVNNFMFLSSYDLYEERMLEYAKKLNTFKPALLTSYPGPLSVFAEYLIGKEIKIPSIAAIICSAETLYPWQKEVIERAFSVPVYNRYGCREVGDIAQECTEQKGLHISSDRFLLEILDSDFNPVSPGETGEVVITDLDNYGMPFIRYRIGDMGSLSDIPCSCGRNLRLLKNVEGRTMDIIRAPNGNCLGGTFWTFLFKSKPGIKAFQVIQEKIDEINVKYIKDNSVNSIPLDVFAEYIANRCGSDFQIHFEEVVDIPKTASGKTRFIISKLKKGL